MIVFTVRYRLKEYLTILKDILPILKQRDAKSKGKPDKRITWIDYLLLNILGSLVFLFKSLRIGACTFKIDSNGLRRESKLGSKLINWNEVKTVHKLTSAYLVELEKGALPLPFRCFGTEELNTFDKYIKY